MKTLELRPSDDEDIRVIATKRRIFMAKGLNNIHLAGTLTQNPELRYTAAGLAILEMNLAGNDHVLGNDGVMHELAWYHRVSVFGALAENLSNQLVAGTPVFVEGSFNYRSWENNQGQKRSSLDIQAQRVEVLSFGPRKDQATVIDSKGQHRLKHAINEVRLIGNLTRDAELRYTSSGHPVTRFTVAINERFRDKSGAEQEKTHFLDVSVWQALAEGCGELKKGDAVIVSGRLVNDSWTDQQGNKRYNTRVEGSRVEHLARNNRNALATPSNLKAIDIDETFVPEESLPF
jgi:single-strand DNA-binding protein